MTDASKSNYKLVEFFFHIRAKNIHFQITKNTETLFSDIASVTGLVATAASLIKKKKARGYHYFQNQSTETFLFIFVLSILDWKGDLWFNFYTSILQFLLNKRSGKK